MTEKRTKHEIDGLAAAYQEAIKQIGSLTQPHHILMNPRLIIMYKLDQPPLLFESSRPGRFSAVLPESDVPDRPLSSLIPDAHISRLASAAARAE